MDSPRVLITGATGFIGQRLARRLASQGVSCRLSARRIAPAAGAMPADLGDLSALRAACAGIETVFHCAGHAHAFTPAAGEAVLHWRTNRDGTRNLLEAAAAAGVQRFVFLSSVKAMAEPGEACVDEDFPGLPESDYGRAKREAEALVLAAGRQHGMHVVVLRPAMVYGAGGRGNLERMGRLVCRGLFPPLPETGNRRALVHVDDLVSAMLLVADDPRANSRTYIVAGPDTPSGRALYDALRRAAGLPPVRWSVPAGLLQALALLGDRAGALRGRRLPFDSEAQARLLGSACYSTARIRGELGWRPTVSLDQGLQEMLRNG